mmetsp:Transcript_84684/g.193112  ORF Transcript_84684/g.193112 Transcript_84684/m.193112 type:complete len:269 (+) Transcript_84684:1-807(+)
MAGGSPTSGAGPSIEPSEERRAKKKATPWGKAENSSSKRKLAPIHEAKYRVLEEPNAEHHLWIVTGDEEGDVRRWDLSPLLQRPEADVFAVAPKREWEAHRKDERDEKAQSSKAHAVEQVEPLIGKCVTPLVGWSAHSGQSVRSIQVCSTPPCILSGGNDNMAKVWRFSGELISTLQQMKHGGWKFELDATHLSVDADTVDSVLAQVREMAAAEARKQAQLLGAREGYARLRPRQTVDAFDVGKEIKERASKHRERDEKAIRPGRAGV